MNASELAPQLAVFTAWAFVLGCCIGSFMNVVVWRLPRGEKLSYPPSHCPKCGHRIRPWENIPTVSWLCLRARCSACHLPISVKYPLGEAATGLLFTVVWLSVFHRKLPLALVLPHFALTAHLLAAALIDAEHRFIPDKVNYSGMLMALFIAVVFPSSRLALLPGGEHVSGRLIYTGFCQLLERFGFSVDTPSLAAVIDCLLGAAFGFAVIFLFSLAFGILLSRKRLGGKLPQGMRISQNGIELEGKHFNWEDVLEHEDDFLTVHGNLKDGKNIVKLSANSRLCLIDGKEAEYSKTIKITARRISTPSDAIGLGDVKLMAMIGAFLGADASIYVLFAGAVLGFAMAMVASVKRRRLVLSMPFAPPLAIAALLWMLFGNVV